MFIRVADITINTDRIQYITHEGDTITINFSGQGEEIVLKDDEAKELLKKLTSDLRPGQFYPAQ
jgi:hypothetical protein